METILIPLLIALGICIALFLLLRELILWYYKINQRIKLLEDNNLLLSKIYVQLGGNSKDIKLKSYDGIVGYDDIPKEILNTLNESEETVLRNMLIDGLKNQTMLIMKNTTRQFEIIHNVNWQSITLEGKAEDYTIILRRG